MSVDMVNGAANDGSQRGIQPDLNGLFSCTRGDGKNQRQRSNFCIAYLYRLAAVAGGMLSTSAI